MKHVRVILEMIMLNVVYLKDMMHSVLRLNIVHSYVIIMIQIHQWNLMYVKMTLDVMLSIVLQKSVNILLHKLLMIRLNVDQILIQQLLYKIYVKRIQIWISMNVLMLKVTQQIVLMILAILINVLQTLMNRMKYYLNPIYVKILLIKTLPLLILTVQLCMVLLLLMNRKRLYYLLIK